MERYTDTLDMQGSELASLAEKGGGGSFEREKCDAWNASLSSKLTGEINQSSRSHIITVKAQAPSCLFPPATEGLLSPLCNGATRIISSNPPSSSQVFSTAAFGGFSILNKGYQASRYNPCAYGNLGALGCIDKPCQGHPSKVDVHLSEVCKRKFVMFDHSGSKRKMIFHPAMMNEFSAVLPSSLQTTLMFKLGPILEKCGDGNDTNLVSSSSPACGAPLGSSSPYHQLHLMPTHNAMDSLSSASDNCGTPFLANGENAGTEVQVNTCINDRPELSCFSHENTEDLEALLSSDEDEVSSTGHSPSDLTGKHSLIAGPSNSEGYIMCNGKKRKREVEDMEDDTCSTATSGNKIGKDLSTQKVIGGDSDSAHMVSYQEAVLTRPVAYDSATLDMLFPDEVTSGSSANNQNWQKRLPSGQQPRQQLPAEQSRKEKIKHILRLLRGIIPGGESMDTAFVLDEAIQYVRTLQSEVEKLQTRKRM